MRIKTSILLIFLLFILSGCWLKGSGNSEMSLKRITPKMEKQMSYLLDKGCDEEYQYLDPDMAMLYSFLPGGGQFYAGEQKKGILYLLSSPLIFPYLASFKDAQNSVDYYNFKYTIKFCAKKLGVFRKIKPKTFN
ncbi:MAG: hypothetical protein HOJ14_03380 [Nitrospina sp.]|nr:hypothetical protein [Nitrospina sp.]